MTEKRAITFRGLRNICLLQYDRRRNYRRICYCDHSDNEDGRCIAKNCPIWKKLEVTK